VEVELHGPSKSWHENGQLKSEATFKHRGLHGLCKHWHKDGQLWSEANYENGKIVEVEEQIK
jgi:antitoxin component YwqK of YwqJK toxin-antitoxin module